MYEKLHSIEDLQSLIDSEAQENLHLDFKASGSLAKDDRKKAEISKDVSAFANSDGGTIVYGMIEVEHKASRLDDGNASVDKEWLENVITSNINPRIDSVLIHPVEVKKDSYAYIVHIPKSNRSPHQASDKKFYKRFNFKSVPMEQYEILDIMNRQASPILSLEFTVGPGAREHTDLMARTTYLNNPFDLTTKVRNDAETPAEYFAARLYIDKRIGIVLPVVNKEWDEWDDRLALDGVDLNVTTLQVRWSPSSNGLVWKGEDAELAQDLTLDIPRPETGASYILGYETSAPHMPAQRKYRAIHVGPFSMRISEELHSEKAIANELAL